ncbi:Membranebound O-acyltransferase domain containing protein 2, putative [Acanthamoeba castellanii str. Neff]|uniref:Membranebound O-acyltransferase domain containing protein 2, putative n=1 Tax=Acanthamoeba castellanii (strain ATCC 30010 / Neff) TaxID=1257118 RepID=L8HIN9_ACACF|nr:Membranebound O-acyltransferase domain containing protein 2, putative [Acanthamoeba castellanii str. Neff]ELR25469.1 Membranebound O-acyltransferase domain containing protein 2, putative [Acanthamoeba castellanii str. Neff]
MHFPLVDALDRAVEQTSVRYLFALAAVYPLALVFRLLPYPHHLAAAGAGRAWAAAVKHLFSVVITIGICSFALGPYSWVHALVTTLVSYALHRLLPHGIAHKAVFMFCMAYLSFGHLWIMYTEWLAWSLNWTTQQMLLTIKLTSCACNIYDGHQPAAAQEKMRDYQKRHAVKRMPSLLEYLGFAFFFPSFLAGPTMEMSDYLAFINGDIWLPTLQTVGLAFMFLPGPALGNVYFPIDNFLTRPFLDAPFLVKFGEMWLILFLVRCKYYFGWYMGEGGFVACGFSYNGTDARGRVRWDRVPVNRPLGVELPENMREVTDSWNICTSSWLKQYVYLRFSPDGKPNMLATMLTYFTSAFWHGFYPGYFMFFLMGAVLTETGKNLRRKVRPWFLREDGVTPRPAKIVYDVLGVIAVQASLSYIAVSFVLLLPSRAWTVYESMYHAGYVLIFATFFVTRFVLPSPPRPKASTTTNNSQASKKASTTTKKKNGSGSDVDQSPAAKDKKVR